MRRFYENAKQNYEAGMELLCSYQVNNCTTVTLEQDIVFPAQGEQFFSFAVFVIEIENGKYHCQHVVYNRADAWKRFKSTIIKEIFPL